jgi:sugar phosphate isomerase/epimerase
MLYHQGFYDDKEHRMQIGIFSKAIARPTLDAKLAMIASHGLRVVQFNMDCAGVAEMPEQIDPALVVGIRDAFARHSIQIAAVSGTFNIIHPDLAERQAGMRRLPILAAACKSLGTSIITLSTGTRNAENMWRSHPENDSDAAWDAMLASMQTIAAIGAEYDVTMAFEPEVSNVVDSALKARRLLDTIASPYLKVVIDAANLFHHGELPRMQQILEEAFALLGPDIVLAHAKDLVADGHAGDRAAGLGVLDYRTYIRLLQQTNPNIPLILHSLSEPQVADAVAYLRRSM